MPGCLTILLAILTTLVAAVIRPAKRYEVPPGEDVYTVVSGTWAWAGHPGECEDNPHTISFSPDRETMILTFARAPERGERVVRYELRAVTRSGVRGYITGETRRTGAGEPVVWDLVLTSRDSYRWHRTDWLDDAYTGEVRRCSPTLISDRWLPLAADDTVSIALDTTIRESRTGRTRADAPV